MKISKRTLHRVIFIAVVIAAWEIAYSRGVFPKLMFPSIGSIFSSLVKGFASENLLSMVGYSLSLILRGLGLGIMLAFLFSSLSILFETFGDIYSMLVSVFDLIPGVALIPLAIMWFGIGEEPIIFIVIHSVIWPMSRSIIDGFRSVPKIYLESAANIGLTGADLVLQVYLPAAFTSLLSGLRTGWARAWRGLISAEMIFGTTSSGAGIGWFIFTKRVNVDIAGVFAALIVIIVIGMIVEYLVFGTIEKNTVKKWGTVK